MRKILHEKKYPKHGDQRTVTRFLLLPAIAQNADGARELRWLRRATILQQFNDISMWCLQVGVDDGSIWKNIRWEQTSV